MLFRSVAIMCRMAGLPSRIATGFNGGEPAADETGALQIRESNRHAWAEVYFVGQGWIAFDATALTPAVAETAQVNQATARKTWLSRLQQLVSSPWTFIVPGALLILAAMFRIPKHEIALRNADRTAEAKQVIALWVRLEKAFKRAGLDISSSRTIGEILDDATSNLRSAGHADEAALLLRIGLQISNVLYAGAHVTTSDVKQLAVDINTVIAKVNSLAKVAHRR